MNFNPYFKKKEMDKHYIITKYSSEIHAVNYPEDIQSSEYKKSSDVRLTKAVNIIVINCHFVSVSTHKFIIFESNIQFLYNL